MQEASAKGTRQVYAKHWAAFELWCVERALPALPAAPETIAMYLAARADAGKKVATIELALAAIWHKHDEEEQVSARGHVIVKRTMAGIRRSVGRAQASKDPIATVGMQRLLEATPSGLLGARDRALLLLGFAGGFRRSELVALDCSDLAFVKEGLEITIRRSKTDQEAKGRKIAVTYGSDPSTCPVRIVRDWLELSAITEGAVFRPINRYGTISPNRLSGFAVATIIKRAAKKARMAVPKLSGHSLRSGFVTQAANNGAEYKDIMKQTGHVKFDTVLKYDRRHLWEKPASSKLGL